MFNLNKPQPLACRLFVLPSVTPTQTWNRLHCSSMAAPAHPRALSTINTQHEPSKANRLYAIQVKVFIQMIYSQS